MRGSSHVPRKSLVRPCTDLARVFSRPTRASACVGLSGPAIAALPGPCSLSGSLDWLACAKWQAACDFWRTGGMVILTTPYAERTAWGMINMIIPCPCTGKAKSTAFFRVNTVDLPLTLHPRQPPGWLTIPLLFLELTPSTCRQLHWEDVAATWFTPLPFFCGVRCSVGVRLSFDSMLTGTAFFWGLHPATSHATFCREDVAASVQTA